MNQLRACLLLLLLLPITALADGKVFRPIAVAADVTIPDQRALIHFSNGVERLVIETRFTGSGTNFAWVVPLPSPPIVEEATTGLFPTLQYLYQPKIIHNVQRYYLVVITLLVVGYSVHVLTRLTSGIKAVLFIFALLLLAVVLLPALAPAKSRAGATAKSDGQLVTVLDRQLVGVFETTTITSRDPNALQSWLRDNGFVVTTNSEPVIESYVKDGWVFVAAKIRRDKPDADTSTPHPLSFTFKTDKPVYPMRLTGVDNGPLEIELYVFGPSRATARHFETERCTRPAYPASSNYASFGLPESPSIVHPLLRTWVGGSRVATKLKATLSPADMREDVWLEWTAFSEKHNRLFSHQGALTWGLNAAAILSIVGLLVAGIVAFICDKPPGWLWKQTFRSVVVGLVLAGIVYSVLPKARVQFVTHTYRVSHQALYELGGWLFDKNPVTTTQIRAEANRLLSNPTNDPLWVKHASPGLKQPINALMGGRIREEDSPGNFTLLETNGHLLFIAHDALGAGHVLEDWRLQTNR